VSNSPNLFKIACALLDLPRDLNEEQRDQRILDLCAELTPQQLDRVLTLMRDENAHRSSEAAGDIAIADAVGELFKLAPGAKTTIEVAEIMAARGHPFAIKLLEQFNSYEYRLALALFDAAVEVHPGWIRQGEAYRRLNSNAPEPDGLIEWFYKQHPKAASAIEAKTREHLK
jgi:hypothetical protein